MKFFPELCSFLYIMLLASELYMLLDFKQIKGRAPGFTQNKQQLITYLVTAAHYFNKPIIKHCVVARFP